MYWVLFLSWSIIVVIPPNTQISPRYSFIGGRFSRVPQDERVRCVNLLPSSGATTVLRHQIVLSCGWRTVPKVCLDRGEIGADPCLERRHVFLSVWTIHLRQTGCVEQSTRFRS